MDELIHIRKKKLKKGWCLYLDYKDPKDNKRHKKYLNIHINSRDKANTQKAMILAYQYRDELLNEIWCAEKIPTFCEYARSIDVSQLTYNARRSRQAALKVIEELNIDCPINKVNRQWFVDLIGLLKKRKFQSNSTINARLYYVKSVLRDAFKNDVLLRLPDVADLMLKTRIKERCFLTISEIQKFAELKTPWEKYKRAFLFSCFTGLRWSDIKALQYAHIKDGILSIRMQKTQDPIQIPLSENAMAFLPSYKNSPYVFYDIGKNSAHFNRKLKEMCQAAGIRKRISFHCARHTFAVTLLSATDNIYVVSQLLGHRSVKTTQVYSHCLVKDKVRALEKVPTLFRREDVPEV